MPWSNKVRELRIQHAMTQRQLAKCVGVSRQTVNAIESNKHTPSLEVAFRIADVFETAVDCLFAFDYEGKPNFSIVSVILRPGDIDPPEDGQA